MIKFEKCKSEWLKNNHEEKILRPEVRKKIEIVLKQQKEMGTHFLFPHSKTIDTVKTHHWFFHQNESETILECPCCKSNGILSSHVRIYYDYYEIYECSTCDYFSILSRTYDSLFYLHFSSINVLRNLNSQLDKHLEDYEKNGT